MDTEENKELQSEATEPISEPVITTAENKRKCAPGGILIMVIALACLAVVLYFIISLWTMPTAEAPVVVEETPADEVEPAPVEAVVEDPTDSVDRNPAVMGLRIDTALGSMLTDRTTGRTLYVSAGECTGECLSDWTPYLAEEAVVDGGDLGTLQRVDSGELQYTWKGNGVYLFNGDTDEHDVLGDGYEGTWRIARP